MFLAMTTYLPKINNALRVLALTVSLFVLTQSKAAAQVANYAFANSSGTYTAITGTAYQSGSATLDVNAISGDIPIGFTFRYNNENYTNIRISNNGFIVFGNQSPVVTNYTPISRTSNVVAATNGYDGAISGFGLDLVASGVGSPSIRYGSSGSDFVVQFTDMRRAGVVSSERITFQIRLTQTTNVISIVYGACTGSTANVTFPQIGLRGASSFDWKNLLLALTTASTWGNVTSQNSNGTASSSSEVRFTTATATVVPNSGRTFTWTPPAALSAPTYATLPATENFDAATWANGNSVQDLPSSASWRTWPSFGDRSWRRNDVSTGANSGWSTTTGSITIAAPASGGAATFNNRNATGTRHGYMDYHVNFSPVGTKSLSFDFRNPGTASLRIYVSTNGGATFGAAVATYTATVANWTSQATVDLGASTSSTVVIRFEATSAYGAANTNLGIDNIRVSNSCFAPTAPSVASIISTSASVSWTAPSTVPSNGYIYAVTTSATPPANGSGTASAGAGPLSVSLLASTTYYLHVQSFCGGSDYSTWATSALFNTLASSIVWTGNTSREWNVGTNWSSGAVPLPAEDAIIPTVPTGARFPDVEVAASINAITVETGASLGIQPGQSLTVAAVLTNDGTINVANGGSLVQSTGSTLAGFGTYTVTRIGSSVYDYWSSPINNASVGLLGGTVYQYNPASGTADPSDDAFDPGWITASGSMVAAKGYAAYGAGTKSFSGTVNNGNIGIGVTSHALPNVSYNLIGNPYPSGVNVSSFLSTNSALLAVGAVYLWDDPGTATYISGDYAVRNSLGGTAGGGNTAPTSVLGSGQSFKVNANGNGTIQFTNAMRSAPNTANIFRQSETQLLWLNAISSDNRFNQTLVGFTEDGTDGNDWAYDAPKLNALGEFSLYSYMDGEPLAIQGYGPFAQERIVPLGFNSDYQTVVTISLDSTENMDEEDIILEDRHYGLFHDLRVSSYVFQSSPMLYSDRFFLHFSPQMVTGITSSTVAPEMQAYVANDMLNLRSNSTITGTLQMFDMSGKMVLETSNVTLGTELLSVDVSHLSKGVYSVRIQDSKKAYAQKIVK